jgi:hypothetical protein
MMIIAALLANFFLLRRKKIWMNGLAEWATVFYHPVPGENIWSSIHRKSPVQQLKTTFFLALVVFPNWLKLWWTNLIWLTLYCCVFRYCPHFIDCSIIHI